jgi:hypothetical protein
MQDTQKRPEQSPAEQGRQDVERANEHAERRIEEIRKEVQKQIDRTEAATRDRDEVGERPVPPKTGR